MVGLYPIANRSDLSPWPDRIGRGAKGEKSMPVGWLIFLLALIGALAFSQPASAQDQANHLDKTAQKITHVFVITLENEGFDVTFGPSSEAPYLSKTLPAQGALLAQYFGIGHNSLDNYLAMISGQAATNETRADCHVFADFQLKGMTTDGQAIGSGCVYPAEVKTLADQLKAAGKTWHGYMEDMGNDPQRESSTCGHPELNAKDSTQKAEPPSDRVPMGDQYASRHNPFVYFHSIIDTPDCAANVVTLDHLPQDLMSEATTPNFAFITPNLCNDGHDEPCKNGQPGGLATADKFLQKWVPVIMASPAYQQGGLLIINFDEGEYTITTTANGDKIDKFEGESCCNQQKGPNLGSFPQTVTSGPYKILMLSFGGDRTGAVALSPFITPGTVAQTPFNHYSLLKTVEDIFGLDHLGYAAQPGLISFFGCASSDLATTTGGQFAQCKKD
jgi:phosphatidylinositol-3-phosphatase